jgi:hypothetical protein
LTTSTSSSFTGFVLGELKCASLRSRLLATEIDSIGVALAGNFVTVDDALAWAHEVGALGLIAASSVATLAST